MPFNACFRLYLIPHLDFNRRCNGHALARTIVASHSINLYTAFGICVRGTYGTFVIGSLFISSSEYYWESSIYIHSILGLVPNHPANMYNLHMNAISYHPCLHIQLQQLESDNNFRQLNLLRLNVGGQLIVSWSMITRWRKNSAVQQLAWMQVAFGRCWVSGIDWKWKRQIHALRGHYAICYTNRWQLQILLWDTDLYMYMCFIVSLCKFFWSTTRRCFYQKVEHNHVCYVHSLDPHTTQTKLTLQEQSWQWQHK